MAASELAEALGVDELLLVRLMRVTTIPGPFSEVCAAGVSTHALLSNVQCACTPQGTKAYVR